MDDESDISLSSDSIIHKQWVVPKRMVLYLQAPEENARKADPAALKLIWRAQAVLVQAHIFECLDFLDIDVSSSPSCDIRGTTYLKPCLLMERIPEETTTPSDPEQFEIEVETVIEEIICEHLYKYYIFTHQVEKRELRIARPVISGVPAPSTPDDSEWVVQPLNSNKLVRSLRGRRKQAHFVVPIVAHSLGQTADQLADTIASARQNDPRTVWLPSDLVILARKLSLGPYQAGKRLSILDFVSLPLVKPYLELLVEHGKFASLAPSLSSLLEWFERIQDIGEWKRAIDPKSGFAGKKENLRQFVVTPTHFEVGKHIPGGMSSAAFKKHQAHVKGPRCDWVNDKRRNHHVVRTPYEDLLTKLQAASISVPDDTYKPQESLDLGLDEPILPWISLPHQLDPADGCLMPDRALRKRQQISNIVHYIARLLSDGCRIVDFCGGGGHISLVLAWLFPQVHVTLVDRNDVSLALATRRRQELGLTNMDIVSSDVQLWTPTQPFNVGVAIHACGSLSDIILEKCIANKASYVMAPCCFGSLQNCDTTLIRLPRSDKFLESGVTKEDYMNLASVADVNTSAVSLESSDYKTGKKAMSIIDHDRNLRAAECGYSTFQFTMRPPTCTPKNEIICGVASEHQIQGDRTSALIFESALVGLTVRTP